MTKLHALRSLQALITTVVGQTTIEIDCKEVGLCWLGEQAWHEIQTVPEIAAALADLRFDGLQVEEMADNAIEIWASPATHEEFVLAAQLAA